MRVIREWGSLKGGNGSGIAAKSSRVGEAPVSHCGREVEEGGGMVCASPNKRKLMRRRKGATMALGAF
jgi:hypothetical protein